MMYAQEIAEHLHALGTDEPAVYVGTYGKYNEGLISGEWLDLSTFEDYDEYVKICRLLHADEADPELMVQDFENFPKKWYSEWIDEDTFWDIWSYARMNDEQKEYFELYMDEIDHKVTPDEFTNSIGYLRFDDFDDVGKHICDAYCIDISPTIERYIDFKSFGEDDLKIRESENELNYVKMDDDSIVIFYKK